MGHIFDEDQMTWPNQSATAIRRVLENPEKNFARSERFARREPSLRAQMSPLQRRPAGQSDSSGNLAATVPADRAFPAAVAELGR
jgi:hypothetical protein